MISQHSSGFNPIQLSNMDAAIPTMCMLHFVMVGQSKKAPQGKGNFFAYHRSANTGKLDRTGPSTYLNVKQTI